LKENEENSAAEEGIENGFGEETEEQIRTIEFVEYFVT
jgi:hypothetical protein